MNFLNIKSETEKEFFGIAEELMNSFVIKTRDSMFRLTEIEFYWNSDTHTDTPTYKRKHADPDTGEWFFHYSGVDIALRNYQNNGYGGILIRGIFNIDRKIPYNGPMVCAMRLFSGISAFEKSEMPRLISKELDKKEVKAGPRKGLGKEAAESGAHLKNYAFRIEMNIK